MLPVSPVALVGWLVVAAAGFGVMRMHHNRLLALVLTSVVGLMVSIAFLHFSAPDLALTQISVEVVTTILMLLALNYLPKTTPPEHSRARIWRDGILAGVAGIGVAAVLLAILTRNVPSIADYYLATSKPLGGGTNVVNVILVDYRGYDTFGEIIVLGIAALAIVALLDTALRGRAAQRLANWPPPRQAAEAHPVVLVVATRVLLPFALVVGIYIFLRGHNEPGGGFIAGLVVGIALIMQYMASSFGWAAERLRVDYHLFVGAGVLIAGLTGVFAWFAGEPFLTSNYGYVHLPIVGEFELATAMGFDLGVFLTVVGVVMLALAGLSRIGRIAEPPTRAERPRDVSLARREGKATIAAAEAD
jgi:multicomponent K+:H+ antiporter subunit A